MVIFRKKIVIYFPALMIIRRGSRIRDRKSRMKKAVSKGNVAKLNVRHFLACEFRIMHPQVLLSSTGTAQ